MDVLNKVMIFSEDICAYKELCSGAHKLGKEVSAIFIGSKEDAEKIANYGVKTYWFGEKPNESMIESYTPAIAELIKTEEPSLLLMKGTRITKLIAGRLSVMLHAGVVPDAIDFQIENDENYLIQRLVYGGAAVRTEKPVTKLTIALVNSGIFSITDCNVTGEVVPVDSVSIENKIMRLEVRKQEGESVNLEMAKRVIGVGRGFAKEEDLTLANELAKTIGAELACSRPIAEGENWMETGRYIGVSGAMIKPDVYIAIGISGQIQHMVGVNNSKTIIAINKDKNAPIFQYADYGIVGDLYKILPKLKESLSK